MMTSDTARPLGKIQQSRWQTPSSAILFNLEVMMGCASGPPLWMHGTDTNPQWRGVALNSDMGHTAVHTEVTFLKNLSYCMSDFVHLKVAQIQVTRGGIKSQISVSTKSILPDTNSMKKFRQIFRQIGTCVLFCSAEWKKKESFSLRIRKQTRGRTKSSENGVDVDPTSLKRYVCTYWP